jgi:Cys-rich protein (TIGR01571 family)
MPARRVPDTGKLLCGCTDGKICCRPVWWATWCVQCFPVAQLLNRFHWSPFATTTKMSRSTVFGIVVALYGLFYVCQAMYNATRECVEETGYYGSYYTGSNYQSVYATTYNCSLSLFGIVVYIIASIIAVIVLIMLVRIRMEFRKHYKINGSCCADFCTMWFCSCCSIMQMLRQTHDEDEYKYSCCSCMTGLEDNAPQIVALDTEKSVSVKMVAGKSVPEKSIDKKSTMNEDVESGLHEA